MEITRDFKAVGKEDVSLAGGKGASLGEMTRAGINVPDGFVVLSTVFEYFLRESGLDHRIEGILDELEHSDAAAIEKASQDIQKSIRDAAIPEHVAEEILSRFKSLGVEYVAVRSSANLEDGRYFSWAGQLDSFLNTDETMLLENVKGCFTSLFSSRAILYRFENNLQREKISVAVVVQTMVQSEVSGTAFSVHPVIKDAKHLVIEAGYGLGEAVVSGQITPDKYIVEKDSYRITEKSIAMQERGIFKKILFGNEWKVIDESMKNLQKLSDEDIVILARIIFSIEQHYGFPCDIEWAFAGGEFSIVQSRPITTLPSIEKHTRYAKVYTRENSLIAIQIWEKHQCELLKEKLGAVVPFSIFDVYDGVANVYYREDISAVWGKLITDKVKGDPNFVSETMRWFGGLLDELEVVWKQEQVASVQELLTLVELAAQAWVGVSISYFLPSLSNASKEEQSMGMTLRGRSVDFLERTDHIIQNTLRRLYPDLGDLVKYVTIDEIRSGVLSSQEVLMNRKKHYIYYGFTLYADTDIRTFSHKNNLIIKQEEIPDNVSELKGQVAMDGVAQGYVRVVYKKSEVALVQEGEILVTAMTTPDYVPAMRKAAAFITDEGGITCHAAIVAREFGKPCIIGTKIATQVLHTGDRVEVDANNGVVRIIEQEVV